MKFSTAIVAALLSATSFAAPAPAEAAVEARQDAAVSMSKLSLFLPGAC